MYFSICSQRAKQSKASFIKLKSSLSAESRKVLEVKRSIEGSSYSAVRRRLDAQITHLSELSSQASSLGAGLEASISSYQRAESAILTKSLKDLYGIDAPEGIDKVQIGKNAVVIGGAGVLLKNEGFMDGKIKGKVKYKLAEPDKIAEWGDDKNKKDKKKESKLDVTFAERSLMDKSGAAKYGAFKTTYDGPINAEGDVALLKWEATGTAKISNKGAEIAVGAGIVALSGSVAVSSALGETKASAEVGVIEGKAALKVNPLEGDLYAEGEIGAYVGKAEVSHKGSFLGIEFTASASANAGVGASGHVGFKDGVFSIGGGATMGVGASCGISIDFGATLKNWGEGAKNLGSAIKGWFS